MTGHLLGIRIDGDGYIEWRLTCDHEPGDFATINVETGEHESDDCWVPDWWDNLTIDECVTGDWPECITFPCRVDCQWVDGLAISYLAPDRTPS